MLYPFSMKINRCNRNCNNINNPYSRVCVPNVAKNINAKVFDLMSWKNKTKQIKWHESCNCECRLDPIICNNKQKSNKDKCRCGCKKSVHKKCNKNFVWNLSSYKCEYKRKAALLVEECEIIDNKTVSVKKKRNKTVSLKEHNYSLDSCKPFVAPSISFLLLSVMTTGAFVYFYFSKQPKRKLQDYY